MIRLIRKFHFVLEIPEEKNCSTLIFFRSHSHSSRQNYETEKKMKTVWLKDVESVFVYSRVLAILFLVDFVPLETVHPWLWSSGKTYGLSWAATDPMMLEPHFSSKLPHKMVFHFSVFLIQKIPNINFSACILISEVSWYEKFRGLCIVEYREFWR